MRVADRDLLRHSFQAFFLIYFCTSSYWPAYILRLYFKIWNFVDISRTINENNHKTMEIRIKTRHKIASKTVIKIIFLTVSRNVISDLKFAVAFVEHIIFRYPDLSVPR